MHVTVFTPRDLAAGGPRLETRPRPPTTNDANNTISRPRSRRSPLRHEPDLSLRRTAQMTKHNLKTHLSWLLNAKPFVPPVGQHIVLPASDVPPSPGALGTRGFAVDSVDLTGDVLTREPPRSQPVVPNFRPHVSQNTAVESAPSPPIDNSEPGSHHATTDMVKLRAAPGSTSKPRLISHAPPNRTPVAGASNRFKEKLTAVSSGPSKRNYDHIGAGLNGYAEKSMGESHLGPQEELPEEWDMTDIDAIDLTGDSDTRTGSSPSIHVPASTSRKRKSDQFEADPEDSPARRRPRVQSRPPGGLGQDEFAPIEDFEEPPPPYSTVAQKPADPLAESQPIFDDEDFGDLQDISALDADDEDQQRVSESPFKSIPKKRKPLSRVPSGPSEDGFSAVTLRKPSRSPNKVNWSDYVYSAEEQRGRPVKASHQSKRRIIADSEDEDGFDFDDQEVQESAPFPTPQLELRNQGSPVKQSVLKPFTIDKSKDFRWHECKADPASLANQINQPQEFTAKKQISSASSKVSRANTITENAMATPSQASPSLLTKEERHIVSEFAGWPEACLKAVCKELDTEVQQLREAQTEYLEEYDVPSRELINQSKAALKRKGVVETLLETRRNFLKASTKKKELAKRVLGFMETEYSHDLTDIHETEAQMKAASEHFRNLEVEMIKSMRAAGFVNGEGDAVHLCDPPQISAGDVVVCSTQATAGPHAKEKQRTREFADAASTQRVQQTQIVPKNPTLAPRGDSPSLGAQHGSRTAPRRADMEAFVDEDFDDASFNNSRPRPGETHNASNAYRRPPEANVRQGFSERGVYFDENDIEEDDEALFSKNMGTPPTHIIDEEEDEFGDLDINDEDMLDMTHPHHVFQETSGNRIRHQLGRDPSTKKPSTKGLTSMGPPANQPQFSWTSDVKRTLRDRFHLRGFRPHQLEAINATLAGKDCFVLMPTGGGKSLCYQLPAVIQTGKTRGVTVVISPLLSLMEDQVNHLRALHVQAFHINGELSFEQRRFIMNALREPQVEKFIQVLYVTPEMLSKNQAMISLLQDLHRRQRLARIVIDEAHCVSQWGHDFRPDYKSLGEVRRQFFGVPVMALTATATENVKVDTIHNLGIQGCEIFAQSFNRPNLYYEVRTKGRKEDILQNIAEIIKTHYRGQSGIVYCLSRKKCELIARQLREKHNISAQHYHAGMEPAQKSETQKAWQAGRYKVIVATIAFGMGIDKPDVRFVIHHSIPKSLEGYYQETGRAGRDGQRSGCYLFYGYQDTTILKKMIDEGEGSRQQKDRQYAMLRNVVQFCENKADCRRVQVLMYFNELFKADDCNAECDNCNSTTTFEYRDFTDLAAEAVKLVGRIQKEKVTLLHCADVFRGASTKRIKELGHDHLDEYGVGSGLERGDAERLFQRLISEDAFEEENNVNRAGFASQYIKVCFLPSQSQRQRTVSNLPQLGRNFRIFQARQQQIQLHVRVSPRQAKSSKAKTAVAKRKSTKVAGAREDYPLSTNVSSPVQMASRVKRKIRAVPRADDEDGFLVNNEAALSEAEDESDAFEPAPLPRSRTIAKSSKTSRQKLGPPITTDEKMARLDELHQDVVEAFVLAGRSECQRILMLRNLRAHPFTDTVLREMAISFPDTQKELMEIPGIDHHMVTLHGERFLKLIKQFKNSFESMSGPKPDRVMDPNHEIIEISDEDDEEDEGNYEEELDLDDGEDIRSSYFQQHEADPEVAAFNERYSQARTSAPAAGRSTRPVTGVQRYTSGKKAYSRKGSRRSSTSGYSRGRGGSAGITKKAPNKKREGGGGGGSTNFSKKGGGGGGASGIGMMPT